MEHFQVFKKGTCSRSNWFDSSVRSYIFYFISSWCYHQLMFDVYFISSWCYHQLMFDVYFISSWCYHQLMFDVYFISSWCYHQLMFDVWKLLKTIFYLKCQKLKACLNQLRVCSKIWYQSVVCFGNWTFLRNVQVNIPLTFLNIILLNTRRFHVLPLELKHCFTKINNKKKM